MRSVTRDWLHRGLQVIAQCLPRRLFTEPTLFRAYERRGWHITPVGFYQPIPDTRTLPGNIWDAQSAMTGVDLNEVGQLALLEEFRNKFGSEYGLLPASSGDPAQFHFGQKAFGRVDAEVLYSMVRRFKPQRIIEIGSGMSTLLTAQALRRNAHEGFPCAFTAIEPYPSETLRSEIPGLSELVVERVENVPLERFEELGASDILFIDSSHVIRLGGDVLYEYLEVIPRLRPGVLVHSHDIFLPAHYPREWVLDRRWFWTEQYLLQALLAFNRTFEVLWAGHFMHLHHADQLKIAFPGYTGEPPGSFWMRRAPRREG